MRALVFDFDGLILDTETAEVEVWNAIFAEHGATFPESWWTNAIGRGADQVVTLPEDLLEEQIGHPIDRLALHRQRYRRLMDVIDAEPIREGILELADDADQAGIPIAICSSSHHEWIERHLSRRHLAQRWPVVVGAEDADRGKPFPDLYLQVCRTLGVPPSQTVTLEDSPNGVRAAKTAGLRCVAYPNPSSARLDLSAADLRLDSLAGVTVASLRAALGFPVS